MNGLMKTLMNDCKTNTMLVTRYFGHKVTKVEKTQMFMHLAGCPHCKRYYKQQKTINEKIRYIYRNLENGSAKYHLTEDQKQTISNKIFGN